MLHVLHSVECQERSLRSSPLKCFHAVDIGPRRCRSLGAGWPAGGRSALRVPHSTETHGPEEATLAEGAGIAANIPRSFTACPQGDAVRRRRRWLPLEFVLGGQNITKMSFFQNTNNIITVLQRDFQYAIFIHA